MRRLNVLVVEDEIFLRLMAVDTINDAGFATVEASDADEAIDLLEDRSDIDLVFSDIKMPGSIDGLGLARAISDRWPHIPTLLTSGHMMQPEMPHGASFLQKPYRVSLLTDRLTALAAPLQPPA